MWHVFILSDSDVYNSLPKSNCLITYYCEIPHSSGSLSYFESNADLVIWDSVSLSKWLDVVCFTKDVILFSDFTKDILLNHRFDTVAPLSHVWAFLTPPPPLPRCSTIGKPMCMFNRFCLQQLLNIPSIHDKPICERSAHGNEAVYIEFRNLERSETIVKNAVYRLGTDWSHTFICGNDNYASTLIMCRNINKRIKVLKLDRTGFTYNDYNNLLLSTEFWKEMVVGEKVLIHQSDSWIFKSGIDNEFLKYDYIGAPFNPTNRLILAEKQVGNGGLSLRSRSVMLSVLEQTKPELGNKKDGTQRERTQREDKYSSGAVMHQKAHRLDSIPEDVFFCQHMQVLGIGNVAEHDVALKFCVDGVYAENSFAMHAMWHGCRHFLEVLRKNYS